MKRSKSLDDTINRLLKSGHLALLRGDVHVEHYDRQGELVDKQNVLNGITNEGKNLLLNVMFNGATQIANNSWFIGLIDNAGFSALAAADTMASHAGWTESTAYTQATRLAWGSGTATAQSTSNATADQFDINATGTIYGIFVTTVSTKGGTTGTLWATAGFSSTVPVNSGDQLKITYSVAA